MEERVIDPSWDDASPGVQGWMRAENREELERLIAEHRIRTVIEIGSLFGLSAAWFARRVDMVTCVDRWYEPAEEPDYNNLVNVLNFKKAGGLPRDFYGIFEDNMRRVDVWDKIHVVRGDSREVHAQVGDADLVYIDGDHSYEGTTSDISLYGPKARKIMCGDDYIVHEDFGVIEAVDYLVPERQFRTPFWWAVKV
jgi:cephalosporin hydroxylase